MQLQEATSRSRARSCISFRNQGLLPVRFSSIRPYYFVSLVPRTFNLFFPVRLLLNLRSIARPTPCCVMNDRRCAPCADIIIEKESQGMRKWDEHHQSMPELEFCAEKGWCPVCRVLWAGVRRQQPESIREHYKASVTKPSLRDKKLFLLIDVSVQEEALKKMSRGELWNRPLGDVVQLGIGEERFELRCRFIENISIFAEYGKRKCKKPQLSNSSLLIFIRLSRRARTSRAKCPGAHGSSTA